MSSRRTLSRPALLTLGLMALGFMHMACSSTTEVPASDRPATESDTPGGAPSPSEAATTPGERPERPRPTTTSGSTETESTPSVAPTSGPSPSGPADPLLLGISVHVEGWSMEDSDVEAFRRHRDSLLTLAREVEAGGGVLTFELSDVFMAAVVAWDDDVLAQLTSMGHAVAVHADVGGRGSASLAQLTRALTDKRDTLAALGYPTNHVSGICSRGPWVEAALAAGFTSTNGAVAYCATSMDPALLTDEQAWVLDCAGPGNCHGPAPVGDDRRLHPFHATNSDDWMLSDAEDGLLLIISESGSSIDCLDRSAPGEDGSCEATTADLVVFTQVLEDYLGARTPGHTTALVYSWSIGSLPAAGFGTDLVTAVEHAIDAGSAVWVGVDRIEAIAEGRGSLPSS